MLRFMAADAAKGKQDGTGDGPSSPADGESATIHATAARCTPTAATASAQTICWSSEWLSRSNCSEASRPRSCIPTSSNMRSAFRGTAREIDKSAERETSAVLRRAALVERQIRNCTEAIASMGLLGALRIQLTSPETQHRELTEKLANSEPRAVRLLRRDTRRFVEARLKNLQSRLTGEA
jgi:hypothetical protein